MSIAFDNIDNFRDVGKTINDHLGRQVVREGVFFRSARPDRASPEDRTKLRDELGIRTVVDLRNKNEQQRHRAGLTKALAPGQIPGLKYREIKVTGERFQTFLTRQLGWWSSFKTSILLFFGHNDRAISILSREVIQPRGLVGIAFVTLDQSGPEIAEALRTFISPSSLPLLVHCALGKDRTGLIVALALMILGVPSDAITHDYQLSRKALAGDYEVRRVEFRKLGLSPEWGGVADSFAERIEWHLDVKYGNLEGYLDRIGFRKDDRERLVDVLSA
ncbi:protein-tyrosine phosphatase-like protein [Daldinia decipiens]|uniref:protein-tyrosine phosphatase-like protein n=1 Tax=Daldinia decipiens TaxID=326647 RepID=UPI0020C21A04|nr:protein-tyrosine phosphatase-like protein [Daldinia decipiens]KAI1663018.1 protein-tyrosine phosphatase-like protein [Daldinia decipiens]